MKTVDNENELTFERVVNAPRPLVWQAWTDPKHASQWWGPDGCTVLLFEADRRPGGRFRIEAEYLGSVTILEGVYEEVVELARLVTVGSFVRGDVKLCDTRRVVTFADADGKTAIVIRQTFFNVAPEAGDMLAGTKAGLNQSFDRLEADLRR
jgi:uncharacterized protein YndB with AHSA1/START domain